MAYPGETDIEMVHRHVREGEEHIARQRDLVDSLPPVSGLAETARPPGPAPRISATTLANRGLQAS